MTDEAMKTSDLYRTENIPERFNNPSKLFYFYIDYVTI